jgi:probable phosphoglycerate mutase
MDTTLPTLFVARHGETAWTISGQHTGTTDLPLTENGESNARALGARLRGIRFEKVYVSPLLRARQTCELAGFGPVASIDADLVEWNYGKYEGRTSVEILAGRPDWNIFRDGCPDGESPEQVAERAARVVRRIREYTGNVREYTGNVLLFSSGHIMRVLVTRWLDIETINGQFLTLNPGSLSMLGYEHLRKVPVVLFWNDTSHLNSLR